MGFTRLRAYLVFGVLAIAAAVVVAVAVVRDSQGGAAASGCPAGTTLVNVTLPRDAAQVSLRVLNGTRRAGLAEQVSAEFKDRGFKMQPTRTSRTKSAEVAVIQFGPKSVGAAQWIRAYFLGEAKPEYNAKRTTDVIDVVLGDRYQSLATVTEVNQSMAQIGAPSAPPGTCPGSVA
ncbi:LytR C-terminal domain-containing protein [Actinoplanes oblitus]|uniref:LytR C-terminal domain-containing protein n=1 Tax=Actinoplanes oblitus TaxID=3040509 RepID=A0ABY8WTZ3_9ACTN|nr:LytR C-terminal domain-containing protein [Actinoplanes oblitus]WIN00654.1 LytR C-terminal domain-containing protein [Actinoplanes oblitus]